MDFILNGAANGTTAQILMANNFNPNALRPYLGEGGKSFLTVNQGGKDTPLVTNTPAALRYEDWKTMDTAVIAAARTRLKLVQDLRSGGLDYTIPGGMGKTVLMSENMTDVGKAVVSMDGLRKAPADRPEFNLVNLPLPIIHQDFNFSAREIQASRQGGSPLDLTMAEQAARAVAETAEQLATGTYGSFSFGGGNIYGITNFPQRLTQEITAPTASAWTPRTLLTEVLAMRQAATDARHYGPYKIYVAPAWDQYLDDDFSTAKGDITLRERLAKLNGITGIETLDSLGSGFDIVLVQMTSNVIREVVGMELVTLQWPTDGGLNINFKVMAILVPQIRTDANGRTGLVHGAPSA